MKKQAEKESAKPAKEEKKVKLHFAGQRMDPTKSFPGKALQVSGKVIQEEEIKAVLVIQSFVF